MRHILSRILFAVGLLLIASPAFAVTVDLGGYSGGTFNPTMYNAWNIYTFGDASVIVSILQSISAMVDSPEYHELLLFVAMLSFLGMAVVASISGTMQGSGIKMLLMFIGFVFLIDVGFNDTINVNVISPLGSPGANGTVMPIENIPFIVGVPESVITTTGHVLTEMFQTNFSLPTDMGTVDGGFDLANSLVEAETKAQVTNPEFEQTLTAFSQNCIMPSIASGRLNPNVIAESTDLFPTAGSTTGSLANVNPALSTYVYNSSYPQGILVQCAETAGATAPAVSSASPGDAYDYIDWKFNQSVSANQFNPANFGLATFSQTGADAWMSTAMSSANSMLLDNGAQTSASDILQAAAINSIQPALRQAAALSGDSAQIMAISIAQGKKQQVSGWATAAALFKEMSGYLYAVLQALVLGMSPLVIIAMFIPGTGVKLVGSYLQVAVWLALWQPLLAIVNYIVDLYSEAQSGTILQGSSGFTMMNMPVVSEFTSRMVLAASFMGTLVPLFAWGIVKGGMAVTDLITQGMGQSIMAQVGNTAATGNITLGNESIGNDTLDQEMLMPKYSVGYGMVNATEASGMVLDEAYQGIAMSIAGSKVSASAMRSAQNTYSRDMSESKSALASASQNLQALVARENAFTAGLGTGAQTATGYNSQSGTSTGSGEGNEGQVNVSGDVGNSQSNTATNTQSNSNTTSFSAGAKGGVGLGTPSAGGKSPISGKVGGEVGDNVSVKLNQQASMTQAGTDQLNGIVKASLNRGYATNAEAKAAKNAVDKIEAVGSNQEGWSDTEKQNYQKLVSEAKTVASQVQESAKLQSSATNAISLVIPAGINPEAVAGILGISAATVASERKMANQKISSVPSAGMPSQSSLSASGQPLSRESSSLGNPVTADSGVVPDALSAADNAEGITNFGPGTFMSMGSLMAADGSTRGEAFAAYGGEVSAEQARYADQYAKLKSTKKLASNMHQNAVSAQEAQTAAEEWRQTHPFESAIGMQPGQKLW